MIPRISPQIDCKADTKWKMFGDTNMTRTNKQDLNSGQLFRLCLDTNIPKNVLKIYPEILNFFPKNPSKNP